MASGSGTVPKKMVRSNKQQITYLCRYMQQHPVFAAGDFKTPQGAVESNRQWEEVGAALDELGPHRSVEQWKVCWRDQKRKARVEGGALNRAQNATGNNAMVVPELSVNSSLILDAIGPEMAIGIGPQESPIGFSPETWASPPPPPPPPPPLPSAPAPAKKKRRVRISHPSDRFLNAQLEHNALLKELIEELRCSNEIKEHTNYLLRRCSRRR